MNEEKLKSQRLGIAKIHSKLAEKMTAWRNSQIGPLPIPDKNQHKSGKSISARISNESTENNHNKQQLKKRNIMQIREFEMIIPKELYPLIPNGNKINRKSLFEIEKILETMKNANCCKIQKILAPKLYMNVCSILKAIQYLVLTYNYQTYESPPVVKKIEINDFPKNFPKQRNQYIFIGEKHFNLYRSEDKDADTIKMRVRWPQVFTLRVAINSSGIVCSKILVHPKKTINDVNLFYKFLDEIVINLNDKNNMNGSWLIMEEAKNSHINDKMLQKINGKYELLFLPSLDALDLFFNKIKILTRKMMADRCLVLTPEQLMEKCFETLNARDFEMFVNSVLAQSTNKHCAKRQKTALIESNQNV